MAVTLVLTEGLVEVPEHELNDGLARLLAEERAPLQAWLAAAHALLARGDGPAFASLLEGAAAARDHLPGTNFEKIQVLCCLAAYYAHLAMSQKDKTLRSDYTTRADGLVHDAQRLDLQEQLPHLVLGQMALARGDTKRAGVEFRKASEATCNGQPSIAGHLAQAALSFNDAKYDEAAKLYKDALRKWPGCPPEVRLGLADCYFKLGNLDKATAAYERVLDLSPSCTPALLGLAVLKMHWGASEGEVREGSQLLVQAFEQDPSNPHVLVLLAHFCLRQTFYDKAARLVQAALELEPSETVKAEALTLLARAHHARGQLNEALRYYTQASQLDSKAALPRYGLAQIAVLRGDNIGAAAALESVVAETPGWTDALQVLGVLYPKLPGQGRDGKAVTHFKAAAAAKQGNSAEMWELLGDVLSAMDPGGALQAYTKAIDLLRGQNGSTSNPSNHLPAKLLNNAAVLHMRAGNVSQACALMTDALASAAADPQQALGASVQVTLGYNMARAREADGQLAAAEAEYQALLQQFPQYGDCLIRLASIAKQRGDLRQAEELASQAGDTPAASDALAFLAGMHLEQGNIEAAKSVLDELQGRGGDGRGQDAFTKLGQGAVYLYSVPFDRRKDDQLRKAETNLGHALNMYREALKRDEGNIYAANGVGCVLAEMGELDAARDVFLQVQEAAAASGGYLRMPDAWVNLANVFLGQEQYTSAIKMYTNTLRKFYSNHNPTLTLYLARALYDADQLPEAKRVLARAIHMAPADRRLQFNAALTMQEWATRTLRKQRPPGDHTKVPEFRLAIKELERAYHWFNRLRNVVTEAAAAGPGSYEKGFGVDERKLAIHINFISETHTKAHRVLKQAEEDAAKAEARRDAQRKMLEAGRLERELAEEKARLVAAAAEAERQAKARAQAERLVRLREEWKDNEARKKAAEKGDAGNLPKPREQVRQEDALDAMFAEDEDDEEYNPEAFDPEFADAGGAGGAGGAGDQSPAASSLGDEEFSMGDEEEEEEWREDMLEEGGGMGGGDKEKRKKKKKKKRSKEGGEGKEGGDGDRKHRHHHHHKSSGRLKKRKAEGEPSAAGEAPMSAEAAAAEAVAPAPVPAPAAPPAAAPVLGGGSGDEAGGSDAAVDTARKRARVVMSDSEDE